MVRSKADPNHISQLTFDEESNSTRVKLVDTQINMELDANDGDSVTSHPVKLTASALGCSSDDNGIDIIPPLDCSSLKEVRVSINGGGYINVMVSPNDSGDFFYLVGGHDETLQICARRIKVKSVDAIGDVHLVGRS